MSIYRSDLRADMPRSEIKKIGIFRALYLGDMLCIIPTVRAIKAAYPQAHVTLIGLRWEANFASRFNIYFDAFIEFPGWPGLPEQQPVLEKIPGFIKQMQAENFDLLLQMQGNGSITNNMCMLWGAKKLAGLRRANDYCPDENLFPVSEDHDHEVLRFLKIADALYIPRQGIDLEFIFREQEIENFRHISNQLNLPEGNYICLHPGARDPRRRWPVEHFAYVANRLAAIGYTIVLTGSLDERQLLHEVSAKVQYPVIDIVDKLGQVDLGELAAIIGHAALLISNDTGVSHIAAALRVPSVIIFSSFSKLKRWAPLDRVLHRIVPEEQASQPQTIVDLAFHILQQNKKGTPLQHVPL